MFDTTETPEDVLRRYRDSGVVDRAIAGCPTEGRDSVLGFLDRYAEIARRVSA
jgi:hypothetical protein